MMMEEEPEQLFHTPGPLLLDAGRHSGAGAVSVKESGLLAADVKRIVQGARWIIHPHQGRAPDPHSQILCSLLHTVWS